MKSSFHIVSTLNVRMWVLASSEASGLSTGLDARMLYSLFWYPVFLALASNVPQVNVPDIDVRLRHNPSVSTDLFDLLHMFPTSSHLQESKGTHTYTTKDG